MADACGIHGRDALNLKEDLNINGRIILKCVTLASSGELELY
jgi:hypothetical protein